MVFRLLLVGLLVYVSHTSIAKTSLDVALEIDGSITNVFNQNKLKWTPFTSEQFSVWKVATPPRTLVSNQLLGDFNESLFVNCKGVDVSCHSAILYEDVYLSEKGLLNLKDNKFGMLVDGDGKLASKHCAASVLTSKFSPNGQFAAFVTKDIERIDFINDKVELWAPKYSGIVSIHLYDFKNITHKVKSFDSEVGDVLIGDDGMVYLILSKGDASISTPTKLLSAISGHPHTKYERKYVQIDMVTDKMDLYKLPTGNFFELTWVKSNQQP